MDLNGKNVRVDSSVSVYGTVAGSCEHDTESSIIVKGKEFI